MSPERRRRRSHSSPSSRVRTSESVADWGSAGSRGVGRWGSRDGNVVGKDALVEVASVQWESGLASAPRLGLGHAMRRARRGQVRGESGTRGPSLAWASALTQCAPLRTGHDPAREPDSRRPCETRARNPADLRDGEARCPWAREEWVREARSPVRRRDGVPLWRRAPRTGVRSCFAARPGHAPRARSAAARTARAGMPLS